VTSLLEPSYGQFAKLWFKQDGQGTPHTVAFEGVTQNDNIVRGRVVLHTAVYDSTIFSWGEVLVEDDQIPF